MSGTEKPTENSALQSEVVALDQTIEDERRPPVKTLEPLDRLRLPSTRFITVPLRAFLEDPTPFFQSISGRRYWILIEPVQKQDSHPRIKRENLSREELFVLCIRFAQTLGKRIELALTLGEQSAV